MFAYLCQWLTVSECVDNDDTMMPAAGGELYLLHVVRVVSSV